VGGGIETIVKKVLIFKTILDTLLVFSLYTYKNAASLMVVKLPLIEAALALKDLRGIRLPLNIS
jgi:hypothetical protein